MARIGFEQGIARRWVGFATSPRRSFEQGIRPKMGGLCNLASSREFARRWVFATFPRGVDSRCDCSPHRKSIIPPEWPKLASSREFARRWVGCATSPRGVDSRCDPVVTLFLLTSPQVHYPTRMVRIGFEQEIRPKIGGLCNFFSLLTSAHPHPMARIGFEGWTFGVTPPFLTSPQVHYPTRMVRIVFKHGIRPKMGGL